MVIIPVIVFVLLPVSQAEDIDCSLEYSSRCKQDIPTSPHSSHELGRWCPEEGAYLTCMWSYEENCDDGHDLNLKRDLHQRKMSILTDMCDPESHLHQGITNNMGCIRRAYKSIANCRKAHYYYDNDYDNDNDDNNDDDDDEDEDSWSAFSFLDSEDDYEDDNDENNNGELDFDSFFDLVDDDENKRDIGETNSYVRIKTSATSEDGDDDYESEDNDSDDEDDYSSDDDDYYSSEISAKTEIVKKLLKVIQKSNSKKSEGGKRFSMSKAEFSCLVRQVREDCDSNVEGILIELQNRLHTKFFPPQKEQYVDKEESDINSENVNYVDVAKSSEDYPMLFETSFVTEILPPQKEPEDFADYEDKEESAINSAHYVYTENDYLKNDVGSGANGDARFNHDADTYRRKHRRYYRN